MAMERLAQERLRVKRPAPVGWGRPMEGGGYELGLLRLRINRTIAMNTSVSRIGSSMNVSPPLHTLKGLLN